MNSEKLGPIYFNHEWNYDGIAASNISIPWECFHSSIESKILSHLHRNNSNSQISQSDLYCRNREVWA